MNKKLSLLLMSIVASNANNSIRCESVAEKIHKIEQLQQELFDGFFNWFEEDNYINSKDSTFNVKSDKESNTVTITVSDIEIEGEQPDATVEMSEEKNLVEIKVTPKNCSLTITGQDTVLSLYYNKQNPNDTAENNRYYSARSLNQTQLIDQHIDPTILPEFSYNKDEKKLSIVVHTIAEKGYQKKIVPITIS